VIEKAYIKKKKMIYVWDDDIDEKNGGALSQG
jgi:hypothetical protein